MRIWQFASLLLIHFGSSSPVPYSLTQSAALYDIVSDTTLEVFNLLAGPTSGNSSAPERLHKLYEASDDVTIAALKAHQTGLDPINEEDLRKTIYSALLAADGRLTRELMGKFIAYHKLGPKSKRTRRDNAAMLAFFQDLAKKERLADHGRFVEALVESVGATRQGLGSIAFVIDTTGSMGEDIETVKYLVKSITTSNRDDASSYVLSPFNDPMGDLGALKFQAKETGAREFVRVVNALKAGVPSSGGDCQEMAMTGILNALKLVDELSAVFVFTDASAKDIGKKDQVIMEATRKETSVSFFGKSDCGSIEDHDQYKEIADVLGGHLVRTISKDTSLVDMVTALSPASSASTGGGVSEADRKRSVGAANVVTVPVDNTVTDLKIVITTSSAASISLDVEGPHPTVKAEKSVGRSLATFHLSNPPPGNYRLSFSPGDAKYSVFLNSRFHFEFSFWAKKTTSSSLYLVDNPVEGSRVFILIKILDGEEAVSSRCSRQVQFLEIGGRNSVLGTYPLFETGNKASLAAEAITPTTPFRVQFVACDINGTRIMRQKKFPVQPGKHSIQLALVGSRTVGTGTVVSVFSLSNYGAVAGRYRLSVLTLPSGTSVAFSPATVSVSPGQTVSFNATFSVAMNSPDSSPLFMIKVSVSDTGVEAARYRYRYVEDAKVANVHCSMGGVFRLRPGHFSTGFCEVSNLGPGDGRFSFNISGLAAGYFAVVSPREVTLKESEFRRVKVIVKSPPGAATGSTSTLKVTALSGRLESGSGDVTFSVQPDDACACQHGGRCFLSKFRDHVYSRCNCTNGWVGGHCTIPVCRKSCRSPYRCIRPDNCGL